MYDIELTPEAREDLKSFRKFERKEIVNEIELRLTYEPAVETRNRKEMRPNEVACWELRVRRFRVFYNVYDEQSLVTVEAIGFKIGNVLFIRGQRTEL